jgi:RNA-directed DNA polymerase
MTAPIPAASRRRCSATFLITWAVTGAPSKVTPTGTPGSPRRKGNVYLHYVLDLWADWWRKRHAHGDVIIVRFADDFIVGFEYQEDAERFLDELRGRFAKFGLELHPGKTRLIEFGRLAATKRARRGLGKPETFDFLGFTHICARSAKGRFWVKRRHMAYYAVPGNIQAVAAFLDQVTRHWRKTLRRRSQKTRINWERMGRIATRCLPRPLL